MGLWNAIKAILSAFIGIRNSASAVPRQARPHHFVIAGVILVLLFIALLLTLVNVILKF